MTDVDSASDPSWHNGALPQTNGQPISGSYDPADVLFLLKCVQVSDTPVPLKEQLIQSGARHYSEMITRENPPGEQYLKLFYRAFEANRERLGRDLMVLSRYLNASRSGPLTLVSLARAGTPIGAILKRWILRSTSRTPDNVSHYSISLIRDRGIDQNALRWIVERHAPESIVFIDGWTGKGVMARELRTAINALDRSLSNSIDDRLMVIADLCGAAGFAATSDDYLIPSSLLGATISGLVSRSIRNPDVTGANDFDGCIEYPELRPNDLSRWFLDQLEHQMSLIQTKGALPATTARSSTDSSIFKARSEMMSEVMSRFSISSENYIKPGIGEATRVLLRRVPWRVIVRDRTAPDVQHLLELAREKSVEVEELPHLPWQALSVIRTTVSGRR